MNQSNPVAGSSPSTNQHRCFGFTTGIATKAALFLSLMLSASIASATVIYSQGIIDEETDVLNIGTLVVANNLGSGAVPVTVNDVAFGNSAANITGMINGGADFSTQFPSGSPLDQLLSGLLFQNGTTSSLILTGLTVGNEYRLQLFLSNPVNSTGKASRVTIQTEQYDINNFGNNAEFIRANFTASAASETVDFGNGSSAEDARMILNAYALLKTDSVPVPVPEPASLALLGLGLAGLGFLRRRWT